MGAAAVEALARLAEDPVLQGDAALALARSPSAAAMPGLEAMAAKPTMRRLAARAYFTRRAIRGARSPKLDALLDALAQSTVSGDRAVGVQALVSFGAMTVARGLSDPDEHVRRAAIQGAMATPTRDSAALAARLTKETDDATKELLIGALIEGGSDASVPTQTLIALVDDEGPSAPLAALALARRTDADLAPRIDDLLTSNDPILRAHVVRGLVEGHAHDAVGRLGQAYAWEADAEVRRAILEGLAAMPGEVSEAPTRMRTLELAARLDPDRIARWTARRALDGASLARGVAARDVAWVRLLVAPGATFPPGMTGAIARPDGLTRLVAFDEDGYALVTSVPAGQALLRLAPRLAAYESASP